MDLIGIPIALAMAGVASLVAAVYYERRMNRHRQPGVTYAQVTLRKDGGWGRADLFTPEGLEYQRLASQYGVLGALLLILALGVWTVIALLSA